MKKKQRSKPQPPDLDQQVLQRRDIVMMLTSDDMTLRLKQLAQQGRQDDCLALMQELGLAVPWTRRSVPDPPCPLRRLHLKRFPGLTWRV